LRARRSLSAAQILLGSCSRCPLRAVSSFDRRFDFASFVTFHIVGNLLQSVLVVNLGLSILYQFVLTLLLFHLTHLFNSFNYCYTSRLRLSFLSSFARATPLCDQLQFRTISYRPLELIVSLLVLFWCRYSFVINLLVVNLHPPCSLAPRSRSQWTDSRFVSNLDILTFVC